MLCLACGEPLLTKVPYARAMKILTTKSGENVPLVGLGTFPLQGERLADVVVSAYGCGYRLFDTADDYRGEAGIGMAIERLAARGVRRESLFIQTKISDNHAFPDEPLMGVYFNPNSAFMRRHSVAEVVREKVSISLRKMNTDYLDSLLIHFPYPHYYVEIWREMIKLKAEGSVRYIGVSNFSERHIDKLIDETGVCPDINEMYLSPLGTKESRVKYCLDHDIRIMAYSPLMDLVNRRLPQEPFTSLARKYGKSVTQIILRWNIERGCMPLPKTQSAMRLKENVDVMDFSLSKDEVALINALNVDYQYLVESNYCPGL